MLLLPSIVVLLVANFAVSPMSAAAVKTGSVIFFHPDGAGVNRWGALRFLVVGPDGEVNLDKLSGASSKPFLSAPDRSGNRWAFAVA